MDITITITASALDVMRTHAGTDDPTFAASLVAMLGMGGRIWKDSDTMLMSETASGMTIGMCFDSSGE